VIISDVVIRLNFFLSTMTDLELPSCPLCNSKNAVTLYADEPFAPYGIKCCTDCGLYYLAPRLKEEVMLALYAKDRYFTGQAVGYTDYAAQEPALRATFRRLLHSLEQSRCTGGTLLEVGCGYGYLLDEARPFFKNRMGTDFSTEAVNIARNHADHVYQGGIDALPENEIFDCIIATHVIEHVYHPHAFIQSLLTHLRPGGCLVVAAPDMGSFWRKLMGKRWPSYKLPEHVLYFDRITLSRLLQECGLGSLKVISYPHAFPLPLIASKVGLKIPGFLCRYHLWLPATTTAVMGIKVHG